MKIVLSADGRAMMVLRSSFITSKRLDATRYALAGENFQMSDVTAAQVILLPDSVEIEEGGEITFALRAEALPIETFAAPSAEEALSDALGLVLRAAIADGRITDAELLRVAPALEGRLWQPGVAVSVGDVYSFGAFLWKCVQAHTTQGDWSPDLTPALWHKVEIVTESETHVWAAVVEYAVGDVVAYPDAEGTQYECLQAHTSQEGWQPPNVPALWQAITQGEE